MSLPAVNDFVVLLRAGAVLLPLFIFLFFFSVFVFHAGVNSSSILIHYVQVSCFTFVILCHHGSFYILPI